MRKNINKLLDLFDFKKIQAPIKNIMKIGIDSSFVLVLFATLLLSLYIEFNTPICLYEIGSILLKSATMFIAFFTICGISFNKIQNDFGLKH